MILRNHWERVPHQAELGVRELKPSPAAAVLPTWPALTRAFAEPSSLHAAQSLRTTALVLALQILPTLATTPAFQKLAESPFGISAIISGEWVGHNWDTNFAAIR